MNWYLEVLRKYAVFDGRARRQEYWMFTLIGAMLPVALVLLAAMFGTAIENTSNMIIGVYYLAILLPSFAVAVRRLHDTGRSGWWLAIALIPLVGSIALLVFTLQDSEQGTNQYGPNPKMARA
jgi:uncharacterized membrane protein YhaH (DUF805 family)